MQTPIKNRIRKAVISLSLGGLVFSSMASASPRLKQQNLLPHPGDLLQSPVDTNGSFMNPRWPRQKGPWFDGWYYRITDKNSDKSIAVIATSYLDPEDKFSPQNPMKGYLAILVSEGGQHPLQVYEYFPKDTWLLMNNKVISEDSEYRAKPSFTWVSEKYGKLSADHISLTLPELSVTASFNGRIPWNNKYSDWGPGGLSTYLNPVPLKWFVHSLGSDAKYEIKGPAGEILMKGEGYVHQEKNWGYSFPKEWIWLQGIHSNNQAQVALAGGTVHVAGIPMEKWVLAYKAPGLNLDFQSDQMNTEFLKTIDPENGRFELQFLTLTHTLLLKAQSPKASFGLVSIPTTKGYMKNGAKESFGTTISVEVYKNAFPYTVGSRQLLDRRVFTNGALEFGANFMTKKR